MTFIETKKKTQAHMEARKRKYDRRQQHTRATETRIVGRLHIVEGTIKKESERRKQK